MSKRVYNQQTYNNLTCMIKEMRNERVCSCIRVKVVHDLSPEVV
jgi:predicted NAD/FAD-binding protein